MDPNQSKGTQAALVKQMAENVKSSDPQGPEEPRVNAYVCQECGHIEFTVDCAKGTTPMAVPCLSPAKKERSVILDASGAPARQADRCDGTMLSAFYAVTPDEYELDSIGYEWRRPSVDLYLKMRAKDPGLGDHLMRGGLILCNRKETNPVLLNDGRYQYPNGEFVGKKDVEKVEGDIAKLEAVCAMHTAKEKRKAALREQKRQQKKNKNRAKNKAKRRAKKR